MRVNHAHSLKPQAGFSLVEMMVAIVAGLIVLGAVTAFAVSTVRSYSENIQSSRLTQELRTSMNLVVREIRRAGYDASAVTRVLTSSTPSQYDTLSTPTDECVVYEYDRQANGGAPVATEVRGIRRRAATGVLQLNASSGVIDCNGLAGWQDITDRNTVQITKFTPVLHETPFCRVLAERDTDGDNVADQFDLARGSTRVLSLCLQGRLPSGDTVRQVSDAVRLRTEALTFLNNQSSAERDACIATPAAPDLETPAELNSECAELP